MINLTVLPPLRIPTPIRACMCVCNTSYWFWLPMMGSVMRCHQNQINLKSGSPAPDAPCRLLFLPSSLPPSQPTKHTLSHTRHRSGGGYAVLCLASHLECICITVSAPVKVNTTPSLWPNRYFCLFCLDTLKLPLKPTKHRPVVRFILFTYFQIIHALILLVVHSSL